MRIDPTLGLAGAWTLRFDVSLDLLNAQAEYEGAGGDEDEGEQRARPASGVEVRPDGSRLYQITSLDHLAAIFAGGPK